MKRPTWVSVVGILGIIFGCLGILGGGQEILMPKIMQMQKEMFTSIEQQSTNHKKPADAIRSQSENKTDNRLENNTAIFKSIETMWNLPDWFATWSIFSGTAKALISAFYLFAAICLLQLKPTAIKLFYRAASASIVLSVIKGAVALYAFSFIGMAMMGGGVFSALIDVVLIIVVASNDKSAFNLHLPNSESR